MFLRVTTTGATERSSHDNSIQERSAREMPCPVLPNSVSPIPYAGFIRMETPHIKDTFFTSPEEIRFFFCNSKEIEALTFALQGNQWASRKRHSHN